jgi:DNA-binding GntR family transcriptional regulator
MTGLLDNKVQAQSLVDVVAERLEAAIFSGQLEPGSRLSEQALATSHARRCWACGWPRSA